MCCFPYLPRFAAKCCILENGVHLLAHGRNVNIHIGNKNTQFAVFCIYPTSKEKGADIHCITAFFMLTTRFTFLMTISPISIERYNQYCLHNMARGNETTKSYLRRFAGTCPLMAACSQKCVQEHINDLPVRQEHINRFGELARYWEHVDKL